MQNMNKKIILSAIFLLFVTVLYGVYHSKKNKQATSGISCADSDGGKNIYTKGSAVSKDIKGKTLHITSDSCATKQDNISTGVQYLEGLSSCSSKNCFIGESYCGEYQGTIIDQRNFIQCPNGCNDGACNPASITKNNLSCDDIRTEAEKTEESMNYCNADSDCLVVSEYLFGCYYITNRNADQKTIRKLMDDYYKNNCPQIIFDCFEVNPKLKCMNGKCTKA
jgi:hypothetical protein